MPDYSSIKVADDKDSKILLELLLDAGKDSPYGDLEPDVDVLKSAISSYLEAPVREKVVLLLIQEKLIIGLLVAQSQLDHPFFGDKKIAMELVWWVKPEYRKGKEALKLLKVYEHWAEHIAECSIVTLGLFHNGMEKTLDKYYRRKGYTITESSYMKVLD